MYVFTLRNLRRNAVFRYCILKTTHLTDFVFKIEFKHFLSPLTNEFIFSGSTETCWLASGGWHLQQMIQ